ncbi:MAG: hypothetical protein HY851_03885 [candidate division Zixibacteria bacterium]|nr:hypothetical protein [candidate division Zixibacteria bacterium]
MRRVTAIIVLLVVTGFSGTAWGTPCGDVNGDGHVDIADLAYLTVLVGTNGLGEPPPPNPIDADVDGRAGLTIGDLVALTDWIFAWPQGPALQCTQAEDYTFATATADSVFFPRMLTVPEGVDTVIMPIITTFEPSTQGVFLSYVKKGPGTVNFASSKMTWTGLSGQNLWHFDNTNNWPPTYDTISIEVVSMEMPNTNFSGKHSFGSLVYLRTAPGTGSIMPTLVNWTPVLRPSVEKNGDLFVPVVQYYDFAFPPETLKVSLGSMSFDAVAGYLAPDSFVVNFTSSGLPISFEMTGTEPWITIMDTGAVGFRTPSKVVIKADATEVGIGNYTGQIQFTNLSPSAPTTIGAIDVSLSVRAPNKYPFGDLDCDGIVDISDLTKIIDNLFISLTPLTPCQP